MSKRSDGVRFKMMPDGNIRAYQSDTDDKRGVSEMMLTNPKNVANTVTTAHVGKIWYYEETE